MPVEVDPIPDRDRAGGWQDGQMGVVRKWQRRVEASAQQQREDQAQANALMTGVPDVAVHVPDAVRVRFEVRPSGEVTMPDWFPRDLLFNFLGTSVGSLLFRDGFNVQVDAERYRRRRLRYSDRLSALADVPRLVYIVESRGVEPLNLQPRRWWRS
jgi:hypothetical protein